ncbi:MAG: bifunctional adenosylcobinamide kinase/adenosylcobinamide-phosphate guanylyltransferase [Desulfobacterales bacterium]|nr:bifunctional adenosylcobinamide kinase/adenosylcobinamide-phosphate guanylyltransferase [Desulfobacterales bacterium]
MEEKITLVIGGCRSGKSRFALEAADRFKAGPGIPGHRKFFIATSVPTDPEMEARVSAHRNERGNDWQTIEEPVQIGKAIDTYGGKAGVILVDCLTLWTSNLLFQLEEEDRIEAAIAELEQAITRSLCPIFLVTNEVGLGIVPENRLARRFRDLAGSVNQRIAKIAHTVVMTVAGIGVTIKPKP